MVTCSFGWHDVPRTSKIPAIRSARLHISRPSGRPANLNAQTSETLLSSVHFVTGVCHDNSLVAKKRTFATDPSIVSSCRPAPRCVKGLTVGLYSKRGRLICAWKPCAPHACIQCLIRDHSTWKTRFIQERLNDMYSSQRTRKAEARSTLPARHVCTQEIKYKKATTSPCFNKKMRTWIETY